MKKFSVICYTIVMLILMAFPVNAAPWKVMGGDELIGEKEIIDSDLIFSGGRLEINGRLNRDLLVLAREVVINGRVEGSILGIISEKLIINGSVGADLRCLASDLLVREGGIIEDSITAAALRVKTSPGSVISGGMLGGFGDVQLSGKINGPVEIRAAAPARIGGQISGDLTFRGSLIEWQSPVEITGTVYDYTGVNNKPKPGNGIKTGGYVMKHETGGYQIEFFKKMIFFTLIWFIGSLLLSIIIFRLFPRTIWDMTEPTGANFRKNLLVGSLSFIGLPLLILLFVITVVGIPLAILLGLFYLILLIFSGIPLNLWFGRLVFKSRLNPVLMILLGSLGLAFINSIPLVNFLASIILAPLGFGMIIRSIRLQHRAGQVDLKA